MKKVLEELIWIVKITVGSALFSLGFNLFLSPHGINAGGVSGLEDVQRLAKANTYGAIIGKAYYTGAIDLRRAIEVAK